MRMLLVIIGMFLFSPVSASDTYSYVAVGIGPARTDLVPTATPCCAPYSSISTHDDPGTNASDLAVGYRSGSWGFELGHAQMSGYTANTSAFGNTGTGTTVGDRLFYGTVNDKIDDRSTRLVVTKFIRLIDTVSARFNIGAHAWERGTITTAWTHENAMVLSEDGITVVPVTVSDNSASSWRSENGVSATGGFAFFTVGAGLSAEIGVQYYGGIKTFTPYIRLSVPLF
jgi:hypothetical protein